MLISDKIYNAIGIAYIMFKQKKKKRKKQNSIIHCCENISLES